MARDVVLTKALCVMGFPTVENMIILMRYFLKSEIKFTLIQMNIFF